MLQSYYHPDLVEAGCDEAGRGCLAGSVYAAAVILPHDYTNPLITDSKQLTDRQRHQLRPVIERDAIAWGLGIVTAAEIDRINILRASILAKTYRDDYMDALHQDYPMYAWDRNKGYPTRAHREAIRTHGPSPHHRMTFNLLGIEAPELPFAD